MHRLDAHLALPHPLEPARLPLGCRALPPLALLLPPLPLKPGRRRALLEEVAREEGSRLLLLLLAEHGPRRPENGAGCGSHLESIF